MPSYKTSWWFDNNDKNKTRPCLYLLLVYEFQERKNDIFYITHF